MVQIILGKKGVGKTKIIIDMANKSAETNHGNVVFIDDDNRYIYDIRHTVRFINAGEYGINGKNQFFGFICGILSGNYDIDIMYIDGFLKIANDDMDTMEPFFTSIEKLSERYNVDFVFSIGCGPASAPEFIKKYVIEQ